MGISLENQTKIFEPFLQEDTTTTKNYGGTGLALTISNKLLAFMDSKLQLISEPQKGSNFYFDITLPSEIEPVDVWEPLQNIKKALIVDDNANNRLIVKSMLALRQIDTTEAVNGLDALQILACEDVKFDVILMDYHMPFMDGIETVKKIRENFYQTTNIQPIVLLFSSTDSEKINAACTELMINQKLLKPIKINDLYNSLANLRAPYPQFQNQLVTATHFGKMLVLIVEDNLVNALLAKKIINKIAPAANIVELVNGLEAVEFCKQNVPDVILMDIQMPVMNGYEATKLIRQNFKNISTPIIALTARNLKGEKQNCLNAGMSDFVAKPIVENTILDLFNKLFQFNIQTEYVSGKLNDSEPHNAHFDISVLKNYLGEDSSSLAEVLQLTIIQLSQLLNNLLNENDVAKLNELGHKLYGTAVTAGLQHLANPSRNLEFMQQFDNQSKQLIKNVQEEIEVTLKQIRLYLKNIN